MFDTNSGMRAIYPIEYCIIKTNPAVEMARTLLNPFSIEIAEKEDREREQAIRNDDDLRIYFRCSKKGIKTRHPKKDMKEIERVSIVNGKKRVMKVYICAECQETYKPHSERVGGRNY